MPAAFQKVMDYTLVELQNTHCFLDDIIIVSRGSKEEHLKLVYKCLKKLDEDNLRIILPVTLQKQKLNGLDKNSLSQESHHLNQKQQQS